MNSFISPHNLDLKWLMSVVLWQHMLHANYSNLEGSINHEWGEAMIHVLQKVLKFNHRCALVKMNLNVKW